MCIAMHERIIVAVGLHQGGEMSVLSSASELAEDLTGGVRATASDTNSPGPLLGASGAPPRLIPGQAGAVGGVEYSASSRTNAAVPIAGLACGRAIGSPTVEVNGREGAVGGVEPRR